MTKSISYEIIAILWFILATMLTQGFWFWVVIAMGGLNVVASMFQSYHEANR